MNTDLNFASIGQTIFKAISIEEEGNAPSACYPQYLSCLRNIFLLLAEDITTVVNVSKWPFDLPVVNRHKKLLSLAGQCIERATNQLDRGSVTVTAPNPSQQPTTSPTYQSLPPKPNLVSQDSQPHSLPTPAAAKQAAHTTPLEEPTQIAMRENRLLISGFQKRVRSGRFTTQQLTNMNLGLQRKISENLAIAREKQESFGNWVVSALEERQQSIDLVFRHYPQVFRTSGLQAIYKGASQFEFHFLTKDHWYQRCKADRDSVKLCFSYLLRIPHHPLRQHLTEYLTEHCRKIKQNSLNSNVSCLPEPSDLGECDCDTDTTSICSSSSGHELTCLGAELADHLVSLAQVFSLLLTENHSLAHTDTIFEILYQIIFEGQFYTTIFDCLTVVYSEQISTLQKMFELPIEDQMVKAYIKMKYVFMNDPSAYEASIQDFARIADVKSPLAKLSSLSNAITSLVQYVRGRLCSNALSSSDEDVDGVGADELLPILCYVILRSRNSRLFLECKFLESFIPEDRLSGAEGYTLTTFITAMTYCAILA